MADDIVVELKAHRDIDSNRCIECGHWTDHDYDCIIGGAVAEIERLRSIIEAITRNSLTHLSVELPEQARRAR